MISSCATRPYWIFTFQIRTGLSFSVLRRDHTEFLLIRKNAPWQPVLRHDHTEFSIFKKQKKRKKKLDHELRFATRSYLISTLHIRDGLRFSFPYQIFSVFRFCDAIIPNFDLSDKNWIVISCFATRSYWILTFQKRADSWFPVMRRDRTEFLLFRKNCHHAYIRYSDITIWLVSV